MDFRALHPNPIKDQCMMSRQADAIGVSSMSLLHVFLNEIGHRNDDVARMLVLDIDLVIGVCGCTGVG
jgi:hypothetical protein